MANFHCFLTWFSSLNFPTFLNTLAFFPESALRVAMWNICDSSSLVYRTLCLCARLNCLLRDSGKIRYSDQLQSLQIPGHQRLTLITQGGLIDQRHANSNPTASFASDVENRSLNDVSEASRMEAGRCTPFEGLRDPSCNWCLESDNHARSNALWTCWFCVSEN